METSSPTPRPRGPVQTVGLIALVVAVCCAAFAPTTAAADETDSPLWMVSGEVGVGPLDGALFVHVTPRLTYLRPTSALFCDGTGDCETFLETSVHVPLRIPVHNGADGPIRRRDWLEVSDFFRILRRVEYGARDRSVHLRAGEIGPVGLGHGTIVNGYYNVVTTDHYRLGLTGRLDEDRWGGEVFVNDLTGPNLVGVRGRYRPPRLFESDSSWRRFALGASVVADLTAPRRLATGADGDRPVAGPDLHPVVDEAAPTALVGLDLEWRGLDNSSWSITPYTDFNAHPGLGTGLHTGVLWNQDIGDRFRLSSRLEYRLLGGRYLPDYVDPVYEITRFRHPHLDRPDTGYPGPKLRAAASMEPTTRHGGFGQLRARFDPWLTVEAAVSDATGSTGADLRFRTTVDIRDRLDVGLFFYQFAPGERSFGAELGELASLDGALTALEARYTLWGPIYARGRWARRWRLREDGRFQNVHLWNAGLGAGTRF